MARMNSEFAERVAAELYATEFEVQVEPTIGGLIPDFLVGLSDGRQVVIEAKGWTPTEASLTRARRESQFFRDQLGASAALVVLPDVPSDNADDEVLGLDRLVAHLHQLAETEPGPDWSSVQVDTPRSAMFCAMPFDGAFDDVYRYAMGGAANQNSLAARRVDKNEFIGNVVEKVNSLIQSAVVVVADMSGSNPNVMFEVGLAEGARVPVIPICSTPLGDLPFDVKQQNTIEYAVGQIGDLVPKLSKRVGVVLNG